MVNWRKFSEQLPTNIPGVGNVVYIKHPNSGKPIKCFYLHNPFDLNIRYRLYEIDESGHMTTLLDLEENPTEWTTPVDFEKESETVESRSGELDNIDLIKPLLDFSDEECFYFLQIMQRRKDGNSTHRHTRIIKNYYIRSEEYLDKKYDEIKDLCRFFNARACIRLNKRNYRDVSFKMMQYLAGMMSNKDWEHCNKAFNKACGRGHAEPKRGKSWVVDVDSTDNKKVVEICKMVDQCDPQVHKVHTVLESPNGYHLITSPFNTNQFVNEVIPEDSDIIRVVEIKKDNPTNLFVPNLDNKNNTDEK